MTNLMLEFTQFNFFKKKNLSVSQPDQSRDAIVNVIAGPPDLFPSSMEPQIAGNRSVKR